MRKINFNFRIGDNWRKMRYHAFWRDNLSLWGVTIGTALNAAFWITTAFKISHLEEIIPLHYNVYFGVDQIGPRIEFLRLPALGLLILIVNFFLAYSVYRHERLCAYFLVLSAALLQIFLLISGILILNL